MRIAVVGAGAIGGFIAAALARSGTEVAVVARGAHLDVIRQRGITLVHSDLGPFTARVEASDDLRSFGGKFDAVLLTFKAHQYPELLPQLSALASTDATIVTLQNGVPFWFVREPVLQSVDPHGRVGALFPDERIVGGVVHVSGHIAEPGKIHQSGGMRYAFGAPGGGTNDRVETLASTFGWAELAPQVDEAVRSTLWLKLVNNVGLNPVSTLHRLTIRQMLERPATRDEVRVLMQEALAVGQALGVVKDVDIEARIEYALRLADVRTSMLQDYEAGRALEIDPILGAVIELGDRLNVPVKKVRDAYERLSALSPAAPA
jgi:2-dehydropantoate 2-reductase